MYSQVFSVASVFILSSLITQSTPLSLYSPDDPLHELDSSNFESVVYKKSHAWIIEFYNNWCGHCIRFAPKWKQFARDIITWRSIVEVAVVNCADAHNVKLCRDYGIEGYPTIKVFEPFINETAKGDRFNGNQDIESMESALVNYLESYQNEQSPTDWPNLHPLELSSVRSVTNLLKDNEGFLILIMEHSDSSLGKKVILDLSFQSSVAIRRVLMTNEELLTGLKTNVMNSSLVTILKLDKSGNEELLFRYSEGTNSTYIRDQIFMQVVGSARSQSDQVLGPKSKSNIKVSIRDSVQMTDLENALRYMLNQEIGVIKYIYGDRLLALQDFLRILKTYFPGKPPIMAYLSKLNDWLSAQRNISGEVFVHKLDELQTPTEYLPQMRDFISCKGSEPKYRGYPCSLWTLFHTLTVSAYIMDEETAGGMNDDVMTVLPNIRNYIKYFFTCEDCVENFQKMDQDTDRDDSTSGNVVLWLWAAHNRVNKRLSGDITEDPQHLKIQFPSPNMCSSCRLNNEGSDIIKWDEVQVLRFLRHFYGKQHIVDNNKNLLEGEKKPGSYTSGNSSMDLRLNQYFVLNLLLWILQYIFQRMDLEKE